MLDADLQVLPDGPAGHSVEVADDDQEADVAGPCGLLEGGEDDVAVVLGGDLNGIAHARRLSHATMRNIRGNLWFAFGYNALGIPIAAGVLYPAFGILLNPMLAALAMALSSVSVIGNALRLRKMRL